MQQDTPDSMVDGDAAGSGTVPLPEADAVQKPLPVAAVIRDFGENDYSSSPLLNSSDDVGIQLLCNAAAAQNLEVQYHRRLIFEVFNDQRRVVFRQNSPENSAVYTYCARQKHIAKAILAKHGVPVPSGAIFQNHDQALAFFLDAGFEVTIKPSDGSSGHGVTCGIASRDEFTRAWEFARRESRDIVVEQNIPGQDIRVVVVAGKAVAAYVREPAHVVGDGVNDIQTLVKRKNNVRKNNPSLRLDLIRRFDLLERRNIALDTVPQAGEKVQLTTVANASAGGETVQVFEQLDRELLEVAERAALCFPGLVQVGVDLIYVSPDSWKPGQPRAYVIEVNSNPGICDTVFPSYGQSIDVPGNLLTHVFSDEFSRARGAVVPVEVELAELYRYQDHAWTFDSNEQRQAALIRQAACALNLQIENYTDSVFCLVGDGRRCTFYGAMPEGTLMVTRKVTRNRRWLDEILPVNPSYSLEQIRAARGQLNHFRLLVVAGKVVSALLIRSGGERGEVTRIEVGDLVDPSVLPVVQETLQAIFSPQLVGIDLLARDISVDLAQQPWMVRDAVCNPVLTWHHFPDVGAGRDVASAIVRAALPLSDFYAQLPAVCVRLVITGEVHGVGFRRWLKGMAVRHAVSGWVRNRLEEDRDVVEAVLEGTPVAVDALVAHCQRGPEAAKVVSVAKQEQPCTGRRQFSVIG